MNHFDELDDEELDYICDYCKKSRKVFFIILGVVTVAFTIGMLIKEGVLWINYFIEFGYSHLICGANEIRKANELVFGLR